MPSTSSAQHRAMEAAAHGKSTLGIPKAVGRDFARADGDTSFAHGGLAEHRQLAKQKAAHFAMGGNVPMPPTMGVSSAYPPPPGHRTEGPRNYGKKVS